MEIWERWLLVSLIVIGAIVLAKIVDWRMSKRELPAAAATRYGILRRSLMTAIIVVGVLSALLVVPQVRAIAAGLLASSAIVGLVVGLAAQRPLANFVAGIVIAFTQPLRLGDTVTVDDVEGVVEEIGLTYTFIKTADNERLVIPNEKLASDTILQLHHRQSGEARSGVDPGTARQGSRCGGRPAEDGDSRRSPR